MHIRLRRVTLYIQTGYRKDKVKEAPMTLALPTQNLDRNSASENFSMQKNGDNNSACRQILESDPAIRVAAFIEGAEVTGFAETARTKDVPSQSSDLRKQVGFWVSIVTEWPDRPTRCSETLSGYASHIRR